jgi:serine/threonine protein kinase
MIGRTISHYKVVSKLGEGGMGVVYLAEDTKLDRQVALKFLPPGLAAREDTRKRFVQEAKAASSLDHPNICTIFEINETPEGQMFISMPYYDGETLQERIARGPVPVDEAVDIVHQLASGLAEAHTEGIVHRDIKPGNILLRSNGQVKIVDFGLAKLATETRLTKTGSTLGTVAYMSPEQARGDEIDGRSDLFSLGVVFYELLTGRLPFRGDHGAAIVYSILHTDPEPLATHRDDMPAGLQEVVSRALAKDAGERYQTAGEFKGALAELGWVGASHAGTASRAPLMPRRSGRRWLPWALMASAAVVIAGFAMSVPRRTSPGLRLP